MRSLKVIPGAVDGRVKDTDTAAGLTPPRIGEILLDIGKLNLRQVDEILLQQHHHPRRFGELAVVLGFVTQADIDLALVQQRGQVIDLDVDVVTGPAESPPPAAAAPASPPRPLGLPASLPAISPLQRETLRAVRSQLMLRWFGEDIEQHTLAIVSSDRGDGRSHVCAHLGVLIAQLDEDVLLIDANLRAPMLHRFFGVDNSVGLASFLQREVDAPPVRPVPGIPHLDLLPAGPALASATELLARRAFGLMLEKLALRYTYILLDTPAAAEHGEALTIAVRSSGCLLLTRKNRSRIASVQAMAQSLSENSVEVLGALVNEW